MPWSREQQNAHELRINYGVECRRVLDGLERICSSSGCGDQKHFSAPRKVPPQRMMTGVMAVIFLLTIE